MSVDKLFIKHAISWDLVIALGVNNTNANNGEHNSLKSRALEKNYNIFIAGCPCSILPNTAWKSGSAFATVTGFDIENHCVDLIYWSDKSSKGIASSKNITSFAILSAEFIKYISAIWLCLECSVSRE